MAGYFQSNPNSTWSYRSLALVVLFLYPVALHGQSASYDAVLQETSIPVGESTVLHLRYVNCEPSTLPIIPEIEGLSMDYVGPNQSSNYSFVNGRQTSTVTLSHQFKVTAQREGTYKIPPIESKIGGKTYQTNPLTLSVSKGRDYSQFAFVKLRMVKDSVYVGEMFQLFVDLYERNAKIEEKPVIPTDGFVVSEVGQPTRSQARIGNTVFNRITFNYLVRAIKTGDLEIGPVTWNVPLYFRENNRQRRRSPFDSFFRDLVDLNSVRRDVTLTSDPKTLTVKPLPEEGKPEDFDGAVGNFVMNIKASPTELTAGDPITLTMTLEGRGALEALKMPSLESWREFKQYPETSSINYTDQVGLSGTKRFEKVVIPSNAEVSEIPEIKFSFFNPLSETYTTLSQPPIPLVVTPNLSATSQPTIVAGASTDSMPLNITTNIVHIKPRFGTLATATAPWISRPTFLWFQAIPLAAWLGAFALRQFRDRAQRNPLAKRRKRVRALVAQGLTQLRQLAESEDSEAFFALLFRLLQEQIGERLDLPSNAITESVIDERLHDQFPESDQLQDLERLFHSCNQSRYAPVTSSVELGQLAEDAAEIIANLQNLPDPVQR
jgi:hypothetical protein